MPNLFTSQTPTADNFDASPLTLGMTFTVSAAGTINGGRFYASATLSGGTYELVLWQVNTNDASGTGTGTLLASATFGALTPNTWNPLSFSVGVAATVGVAYRIAVRTSVGRYQSTSSFWTTPLTNGNITGIQDGSDPVGIGLLHNGNAATDITSYPNQNFGPTNYFVDVDFTPSGAPIVDLAASLTATGSLGDTLTAERLLSGAFTATGSLSAALVREAPLAAGLTATASMSAALLAERLAAAGLTATGSMSAAFASQQTMSVAFTATAGMSAALTVPTVGPVDPIADPVANALLVCLTAQMNELVSPPAKIELRAGAEGGPLIGPNVDECCAGLAWVRVASVYPSWDSFPSPDNTWLPCGPLAYAVVLEMGSAFCMPWSDSSQEWDNVDPPSTADWANAHTTLMQHQTLMRRAAACCFPHTQHRAVGEWNPLSVEGGCMGGTLRVTVSVMAPCGDC